MSNRLSKILLSTVLVGAMIPLLPALDEMPLNPNEGQIYDGVEITDADYNETPLPGGRLILDRANPIETAGERVLGINWNWWRTDEIAFDDTGRMLSPRLVDLMKPLPMALNRMSGSNSQHFSWKASLGPFESRPPQEPDYYGQGGEQPIRFGLMEWLEVQQRAHPSFGSSWVFNMISDTPQDAADLVAFLTLPVESGNPWAAKRAGLGQLDPIRPVLWELGNELDHNREALYSEQQYVAECKRWIEAVQAIDPDIPLAAHVRGSPWNRARNPDLEHWRRWHRLVLKELGPDIDYLTFHPYYKDGSLHRMDIYLDILEQDIREVTGDNRIKILTSEHGVWPDRKPAPPGSTKRGPLRMDQTNNWASCLTTSDFFVRLFSRESIGGANYHSLRAGPWAVIDTDGETLYPTALARTLAFWKQQAGSTVIPVSLDGVDPGAAFNTVSAVAFKHPDGIHLVVINKHPTADRILGLAGTTDLRITEIQRLSHPSGEARNLPGQTAPRVRIESFETPLPADSIQLPPLSLTRYRLQVESGTRTATTGQEYTGVQLARERTDRALRPEVTLTVDPQSSRPVTQLPLGMNNNWFQSEPLLYPSGSEDIAPDFLAAARDLPISLSRMSGTASQHYNWKQVIGPLENRVPQNPYAGGEPALHLGPLEWVRSVLLIDPSARISWTLNLTEDSVADHADLARLFTAGPGDPWGERRIAFGLEEPVPVFSWELGNELDWGEHRELFPLDHYIEVCRETIAAVRAVDPEARFAAHAVTAPWSPKAWKDENGDWATWHRRVLEEIGDQIDFLVLHPYYHGLPMATIESYLDRVSSDIIEITGEDRIKLYISEHALWPERPKDGRPWSVNWHLTHALKGCLATSEFFNRIYARGDVAAAAYHCFSGGPWAIIRRDEETGEAYRTGIYELLELYDRNVGPEQLAVRIEGDGCDPAQNDLSFTALATRRGDSLHLILTNRSSSTDRIVQVNNLPDHGVTKVTRLTGPSLESHNTLHDRPLQNRTDRIEPALTLTEPLVAPAGSITAYTLTRRD